MEKTLSTLQLGTTFTYAGVRWIILQNLKAALVIAEKVQFNKQFCENGSTNWAMSSLRGYLHDEYIKELVANGANPDAFLEFTTDLTTDDGKPDYGISQDRISLLTCNQYRRYRYIISRGSVCWWTATSVSSQDNAYSLRVRNISNTGTLGSAYACMGLGIRPVCKFDSSIVVATD